MNAAHDGACRCCGVTQACIQRQQPRPAHLVDQSRQAGTRVREKEQNGHDPPSVLERGDDSNPTIGAIWAEPVTRRLLGRATLASTTSRASTGQVQSERVQSLLHFVRWRLGLDIAEQWMAPEESACLIAHARGKKRLAEIGVWEGGTTRRLCEVMASDATIHAIDPYPPGRSGISYQKSHRGRSEVAAVSNGRVVWLRQTGAEAAQNRSVLAAPFDFIFVDGDHTYEGLRQDWEGWSPLVGPGGIVALHDSLLPEGHLDAGSVRYSNEVVVHDPRFETVDEVASLRVLRRVAGARSQMSAIR